jgi:hypothetical protein
MGEGFRFILSQRLTTALVALVAIASIFGFPYAMLLPVFARDVLHAGATGLGWLLAATGAGGSSSPRPSPSASCSSASAFRAPSRSPSPSSRSRASP